eukprot:g7346.t1
MKQREGAFKIKRPQKNKKDCEGAESTTPQHFSSPLQVTPPTHYLGFWWVFQFCQPGAKGLREYLTCCGLVSGFVLCIVLSEFRATSETMVYEHIPQVHDLMYHPSAAQQLGNAALSVLNFYIGWRAIGMILTGVVNLARGPPGPPPSGPLNGSGPGSGTLPSV